MINVVIDKQGGRSWERINQEKFCFCELGRNGLELRQGKLELKKYFKEMRKICGFF